MLWNSKYHNNNIFVFIILFFNTTNLISSSLTLALCSSSNSNSNYLNVKVTPCTRICRYNANFFDGQVCIGCFRDTTEISTWSQMKSIEKGYALEDAVERCDSRGNTFEASISAEELRKQAQLWFELSSEEKKNSKGLMDGNGISSITRETTVVVGTTKPTAKFGRPTTFVSDDSNISLNKNQIENMPLDERSTDTITSTTSTIKHNSSFISNDIDTDDRSLTDKEKMNDSQFPSPCKEKCTFDSDFWDGQVCKKCFRDTFEANNWDQLNKEEKMMAFTDMADRARQRQGIKGETEAEIKTETNYKWEEIDIATQQKIEYDKTFNTFLEGDSVILLPSVVDEFDYEEFIERVSKVSRKHREERISSGLTDEGLVRLPSIDAATRAKNSNTPCAKPIDNETNAKLKNVLQKVFKFLDLELSPLVKTLFGKDSVYNLHELNQLVYSSREPAINVYTTGGKFLAHEDGQQMTILIPLSSPDEFGGGGTAFWSQESRGHRVDPPSLVLKPSRGRAMLFGGNVTHSGLPIEWGQRVVFAASFSIARK